MLIELAHYLMIFSAAVFGLEAAVLTPLLWEKASAVSIRSAFRGVVFGCFLLFACFFTFAACFVSRDFSLAVVFETFAADTSVVSLFPAVFSSREGFFFVWTLIFSGAFLIGCHQRLATYQERGRYLFSGSIMLFFMMILMICTANPFIRLDDPPLEGLSLNPFWQMPFMTLKTLFSVTAFALLTVVFIRMISVYEKGWRFAERALTASVAAEAFLAAALALDVTAAFTGVESQSLMTWEPSATLLFAVFLMTAAQCLSLQMSRSIHAFGVWSLIFSLTGLLIAFSAFFAHEYSLFSLKLNKAYFPNPIIAFSATFGVMSLLLFCAFSFLRKTLEETSFSRFSRETFLGLAAVCAATLAVQLAVLSFSPVLLLFHATLLWGNLPAFFTKQMLIYLTLFSVFVSVALFRTSVVGHFEKLRKKLAVAYVVVTMVVFVVPALFYGIKFGRVFLWTLPSLVLFFTVLNSLNFKLAPVPQTVKELLSRLKSVRRLSFALFFLGAGGVLASFSLAAALTVGSEEIRPLDMENGTVLSGVRLTPVSGMTLDTLRQSKGAVVRPVDAKTLAPVAFNVVPAALAPEASVVTQGMFFKFWDGYFVKVQMANETEPVCSVTVYPFLRLFLSAFFCFETGLLLLYFHLRAKGKQTS